MDAVTFSVVIPTYNRPNDLLRCVDSISTQSAPPREVLIIDDAGLADTFREFLYDMVPESTTLIFSQSRGEPGLCAARNRGVELASESVILFLDDDVELETDYLQHIREVYEQYDDPELAGVGGFDDDHRTASTAEQIFNQIFLLGNRPWQINTVGFESTNPNIDNVTKADWLSGYNSSYKRDVLGEEPFTQNEGGRETLDDIELGWRLSREGFYFLIDPRLQIEHHDQSISDSGFDVGTKRARNRVRIFNKYGSPSNWPIFMWCMIGEITKHILAPLVDDRVKYHVTVAVGMIVGYCQISYRNLTS